MSAPSVMRTTIYNVLIFFQLHNPIQSYCPGNCNGMQCSAVQCSAVQYSAVQCSAVQYSAVQYSSLPCTAVLTYSLQGLPGAQVYRTEDNVQTPGEDMQLVIRN